MEFIAVNLYEYDIDVKCSVCFAIYLTEPERHKRALVALIDCNDFENSQNLCELCGFGTDMGGGEIDIHDDDNAFTAEGYRVVFPPINPTLSGKTNLTSKRARVTV